MFMLHVQQPQNHGAEAGDDVISKASLSQQTNCAGPLVTTTKYSVNPSSTVDIEMFSC